MTRYRYQFLTLKRTIDVPALLNEYGNDGWHVVFFDWGSDETAARGFFTVLLEKELD